MFRTNKISFFGVIFSQDGISPDPAKVKAVREFSHPQNVKDLRSFLEMTNYCFVALYENLLTKTTHESGLKHAKKHL